MKTSPLWLSLLLTGYATAATLPAISPWVINEGDDSYVYVTKVPTVGSVKIRSGYFRESTDAAVPFKGCVMYLEGLGDSMMNHVPYFTALSQAGYRVIAFDYMGQGGSEGSMNNTRIVDKVVPSLQISRIAESIWEKYATMTDQVSGQNCAISKKIVIGWSTGALAAYDMAHRNWADAVVLLTPGVFPKKMIGEAALNPMLMLTGKPVISERTLTRNDFEGTTNPHYDRINPATPVKVPFFSSNYLITAKLSRSWAVSPTVKGLVFASGVEDTYVDSVASTQKIQENTPHFKVVSFPGALHELDNELPEVALQVQKETVEFLATVN